jgi:hypothetical protein
LRFSSTASPAAFFSIAVMPGYVVHRFDRMLDLRVGDAAQPAICDDVVDVFGDVEHAPQEHLGRILGVWYV